MYSTGANVPKVFRDDEGGKEKGMLGEHESHATAVLGLLFADSGGDECERRPRRDLLDRTAENGVRDQVEGGGREKEARGGIRPETRDLHVYSLVAN